MSNIIFLIRREFSSLLSNKILATAFLLLPLLLALVLGFVYSEGRIKKLPIVVVDRDNSPLSSRLCDMMEDHPTLHVITIVHETVNLHQVMLDTRAVAVVVIPYRFEAGILTRSYPEVNCYLNMTNTLTASNAGGAVSACAGTLNAGIAITSLEKKGVTPAIATENYEAVKLNIFQQYNSSGNYMLFLWPGLIFSVLQQVILVVMAVSFSREFASGFFTKEGLLAYSHSALVLILAKLTPCLLLSLVTIGNYYLLGIFFKIPVMAHGGLLLVSVLLLLLGTCFLGMLYSIIFTVPLKASQLLMSVASPAFTLSGFTWPAEQLPVLLRAIAQIIPLTPFVALLRKVFLQNASLPDVLPEMQQQLILVSVYLVLSFLLLKRKVFKAGKPVPVAGSVE